ncbi:hypothetical protein [Sneathiella sp.]|uniref:hypothetical protein n=1 Tax=Sneathiella sp. TaxID=1964365 RepID=UPI0035622825
MDPTTLKYVASLAQLGFFISQSVVGLLAGAKTPAEIESDWPAVKARKDAAWAAWKKAGDPQES